MSTYRDIFKWGDKHESKLESGISELLMDKLNISASDFELNQLEGNESIHIIKECGIEESIVLQFKKICGNKNVSLTDNDRALHAYGKHFAELLKLRLKRIENPPDLVIYPNSSAEIAQILSICNKNKIPVIPFGGGSSVTGALQAPKGGVSIDLSRNFNQVLEINYTNCTATVCCGILGPDFEKALNKNGYTCGHFPQSFEFSTVGGWIAARGAGTLSTGYGKMEEIVLSMKVATPSGLIVTSNFPADAQAIDLKHIFMGSEGIFGIITEAVIKIRKYKPENTAYASFIFKSFENAVDSMRETMQSGYGKPHLFRISDPDETDVAFKMKGFNNSLSDKMLRTLGYKAGERVLMFVTIEGESDYPENLKKNIKRRAKKFKGFYIGTKPVKKWLEQRYTSAYARDPIMDKAIITDTFETSVYWENLIPLWKSIRQYINSRPYSVSMMHISHVYENGANLYITFLTKWEKGNELDDYSKFHKGMVDCILLNKGSLSHHHGIGRVLSPWMKKQYGENEISILQAIKNNLDPENIMNPGKILGLE